MSARETEIEEAAREIVFTELEMLTREQADSLLSPAVSTAQLLQESQLLGLLDDDSVLLFPVFQFDPEKRRLRPEVRVVNQLLNAYSDPLGVASFWASPTTRVNGHPKPFRLVLDGDGATAIALTHALLEGDD